MIPLFNYSKECGMRLNLSLRTGVYFIRNIINENLYIGSAARNFSFRFRTHANTLKHGTHPNRHLLSAWRNYGPKSFECGVIEDCRPSECVVREQKWLDFFKPHYNFCRVAGSSLGTKHTESAKRKVGLANTGRPVSDEVRGKISLAAMGRKHSPETLAKISASSSRQIVTEATRNKLSILMTGRKQSKETIEARVSKMRGVPRSEEEKRKISVALKGRKVPWIEGIPMRQEVRDKISKSRIGYRHTPEAIKKMSDSQKLRLALKRGQSL